MNATKAKQFIRLHYMGLGIFIFLMMDLVLHLPEVIDPWNYTWYTLDYSLGFGVRMLMGSILHAVFGTTPDHRTILRVSFIGCCILIALFAILMDNLFSNSRREHRRALGYLMILFNAAPYGIRHFWSPENFGRLDMYLIIATVAALLVLFKTRKMLWQTVIITGVSLIGLLIHPVYFFIFFPIVLAFLIIEVFDGTELKIGRILPALICCLITGLTFLWLQLFTGLQIPTFEELCEILNARTDYELNLHVLDHVYYRDIRYTFEHLVKPFFDSPVSRKEIVLTIVLVLPMILLNLHVYREMASAQRTMGISGKKRFLHPYPWLALAFMLYIPPYILAIDWYRWIASMFLFALLAMMLLLRKGDAAAQAALMKLDAALSEYPLLFIIILIYAARISPLEGVVPLPEVQRLIRIIW